MHLLKNILIPIITIFITYSVQAQFFIIKDPDGYVNVRDSNKRITDHLSNGKVKTKSLYLSAMNGDGADGYVVLWYFNNDIYKDRIVTHGF